MNHTEIERWLQERLPPNLCAAPPTVAAYDDEIVVMLRPGVELRGELPPAERSDAEAAAITRLREETRPLRMRLARELQRAVGRPVAWGMRVGDSEALFSSRTAPVMTRLSRTERDVLDTLVGAGVADTRSAALAYIVRAFAAEHAAWLDEARRALEQVEQLRARLQHAPRPGAPPDLP